MRDIDYLSRIEFMWYYFNNTQINRDLIRSFGMDILTDVGHADAPHLALFVVFDGEPVFMYTHGTSNSLIPDDLVEEFLALIAIRSDAIFQFVENIIKPRINA